MKVDVFSVGETEEQWVQGGERPNTGAAVEVMPQQPLGIIERAQIDMQIATAKQFPRSLSEALDKAKTLACYSPLIASKCTYSVPQGGKKITGPSIRVAEIMATSWGNLRYGGRVLSVGDRIVTCQGVCHDLETNVSVSVEVTRSIIDSNNHRYSDSMIVTTSMAGIAIGIRNAIFKVIPGAFVDEVLTAAQKVARGEDQGLEARLNSALAFFEDKGVKKARVFVALGIKGAQDVTWEHIDTLLGYATSIRVEDIPISEIFPNAPAPADAKPPKPPKPEPKVQPDPPPSTPKPKPESPAPKTEEVPTPPSSPTDVTNHEPEPEPKKSLIPESKSATAPAEGTAPKDYTYSEGAYVLGQHGASWAMIYTALELGEGKEPTAADKAKVCTWAKRVDAGEALETVLGIETQQTPPGPAVGEELYGKKKADTAEAAEVEKAKTIEAGSPQLDF